MIRHLTFIFFKFIFVFSSQQEDLIFGFLMEVEYKNGMKINLTENNYSNTNTIINQTNSCSSSSVDLNTTNTKNESSTSIPIGIATSSLNNSSKPENNLKLFIKTDPDVCLSMLFENSSILDQYRNIAKSSKSAYVNYLY